MTFAHTRDPVIIILTGRLFLMVTQVEAGAFDEGMVLAQRVVPWPASGPVRWVNRQFQATLV
jgi:hypothetical protein